MTISGRLSESLWRASAVADEQRSPLGLTLTGRPVWPIYGAEPEDDDDDDQDDLDDDDDDDEDDTGTGKSKEKSKEKSKDDDDDEDDALAEANARAERYKKRMRAADRRANDLDTRLKALEKGDKDGDGEPSADLVTAQKEVETLREVNSTLRVENSFLLNNTFTWHDPKDVLALVLKDDDVEVDEDGEVQGIAAALKKIAKAKPWLVKKDEKPADDADDDEDDDDEEDDDRPAARRRRPSGGAQNGKRGTKGADRAQLVQTYPALNRR